MIEPMKAAVFICRGHGVDPSILRSLLKDPRIGHTEILSSCCTPEGRDQIQLHLRGRTTQALLVIGCPGALLKDYQALAASTAMSPARVAVVPAAACRTVGMAELSLSCILDPREASFPPRRTENALLLIGEGRNADAALEQAKKEGLTVHSLTPFDLLEGQARLLGGPGRFSLEVGESIHGFGAALLVMDHQVTLERERWSDGQGTMVLLAGGEECADVFLQELESTVNAGGKVFAVAQETPFTGCSELRYAELQGRGVTFLRAAEVTIAPEGAFVKDQHLGEELVLPVAELVTIGSSPPLGSEAVLKVFGLPAGQRVKDMRPGESGQPGVFMGGSTFTTFMGQDAEEATLATVMIIADALQRSAPSYSIMASIDKEKCSLCLTCLRICPYQAPFIGQEGMIISTERCQGCGLCLSLCPSQAIEMPPADLRGEMDGTKLSYGGKSS